MSYDIAAVLRVYQGSDGEATKALYAALEKLGPDGEIAANVFRAVKCSERAKVYRGGRATIGQSYKSKAYERKEWALNNLTKFLALHGGFRWGWGIDKAMAPDDPHKNVLYVDIPTGQVSFHSPVRLAGPCSTARRCCSSRNRGASG
jgi:hypothetical protein